MKKLFSRFLQILAWVIIAGVVYSIGSYLFSILK